MAKKQVVINSESFWKALPRPFFALAPMANVTDSVFRKMISKYGKPDVMWTEFVSADGLISAGKKKLLVDLVYSEKERPIIAQLFTAHPDKMRDAAKIVADLGFDALDINMGCPDKSVEKQGGGSAMMKNPKLALEVLRAAREGVAIAKGSKKRKNISVTVKTRIGYNKVDMGWIKLMLEQKLPALTIHLRTRKEMSDVPAHWELMPEIVKMRDEISPETLIIGNGDVASVVDGIEKAKKYGCDGLMVGRGIFGKPWFFGRTTAAKEPTLPGASRSGAMRLGFAEGMLSATDADSIRAKLKIMLEHAKLFDKTFKKVKNFAVIRKHFKAYVSGWEGAKELRAKLMQTENYGEVEVIVKEYLKTI